jgi:mevalonate kinase
MIKISAPGKLMLFGEHAVLFGQPCLVTSLGLRLKVFLKKRKDGKILVNAPEISLKNYLFSAENWQRFFPKKARFLFQAIFNFFQKYQIESGLEIKTESQFLSQFGLGSSSAIVVSTIKGLAQLFKIKIDKKELFDLAYQTVLDVQKAGSGFDIATAIWGGVIYFLKGGKKIEPLKVNQLPLIIGYTGIKADTVEMIKEVAERRRSNPNKVDRLFNQIGKIVKQAKLAIENSDFEKVGRLMNLNQNLLRELGVSSKELEDLIEASLKSGAYGAKLSGAGGGDCMIALAPKNKLDSIKRGIEKAGGKIIEAKVPAKGVKIESF